VSYVLKEYIPTNSITAVRNDKNHGIPIAMLNKNIMNISNSFISRFIFYTSLSKSLCDFGCWLRVRICFTNSQLFVVCVGIALQFWLLVVWKKP
jgi:hypothetical protein